jgi:hypothetical protein
MNFLDKNRAVDTDDLSKIQKKIKDASYYSKSYFDGNRLCLCCIIQAS